jgi:hypothetical protein
MKENNIELRDEDLEHEPGKKMNYWDFRRRSTSQR